VVLVNSQTQTSFIETFRQQAIKADSELIAALTAVSANDKYVGSQIVSVSDAEYDTIREAYRAIGQGNFIE
jgi:phosphonate transport system substrate-binding protein